VLHTTKLGVSEKKEEEEENEQLVLQGSEDSGSVERGKGKERRTPQQTRGRSTVGMPRTAGGCTGEDGARTAASAPTELASQLKATLLYEPLESCIEIVVQTPTASCVFPKTVAQVESVLENVSSETPPRTTAPASKQERVVDAP
jgi:hypothetical protein